MSKDFFTPFPISSRIRPNFLFSSMLPRLYVKLPLISKLILNLVIHFFYLCSGVVWCTFTRLFMVWSRKLSRLFLFFFFFFSFGISAEQQFSLQFHSDGKVRRFDVRQFVSRSAIVVACIFECQFWFQNIFVCHGSCFRVIDLHSPAIWNLTAWSCFLFGHVKKLTYLWTFLGTYEPGRSFEQVELKPNLRSSKLPMETPFQVTTETCTRDSAARDRYFCQGVSINRLWLLDVIWQVLVNTVGFQLVVQFQPRHVGIVLTKIGYTHDQFMMRMLIPS